MVINNLTKNWQEIIWWPDTTLTMQNGTGIENYAENGGFALSQNNPNPFSGTTDVSLTVAEEGKVQLEIADMNGRTVVESQNYTSLQPGNHQFRVSLSTIGAYVMTARQNGKTSSIKMICNGGFGTNAIDYLGETQSITYMLKSTTNKPFNYGDMMEYIGYATFNGSEVESQRITQAQGTSQTFTLQFAATQLPNAPTGITATVSGTQIYIIWNSVSNATSYKVYRSSSASGSYSQIGSATSNTYLHDSNPLIGYNYYKVKAVNSAGESDYSPVASCNYVTVPDAPTNVTATVSGSQIHVSWGSVSTATSYKVYRSSSANGSYTQIGSPTSNNYFDANPLTGYNYYKVKAVNSAGESVYSPVASCNYVATPDAPTGVTATVSGSQIYISWGSVSNASSYKVYRSSTSSGTYSQIGSATSSTYLYDSNPLIGYNYYKVKAVNSAGEGAYSSVASCNYVTVPEVTTNTTANNITSSTATCGGNVSSSGGATVTSRGVCWDTLPNPTISGAHTSNGSGTGSFTSNMSGLAANTVYYVRAYATNSAGTNYGEQRTFSTTTFTCGSNTTDYDGNSYNTVQIGSQCWTKENLKVTSLNNGITIPLVQNASSWGNTSSAAYCYYNFSSYGCLYNYYAVSSGLLCPPGWHVPSYSEVHNTLDAALGGGNDVGGKMKTTGTTYWFSPNTGATNSSGFSARGGGYRWPGDSISKIKEYAVFWTSTTYDENNSYDYVLGYNFSFLGVYGDSTLNYSIHKKSGLSVRCLRDESTSSSPCDADDQCTYTFNLTDSYGDGWNGGVLSVQQNGVTVATITLSEGSSGTETVNLCNNISTSLLWTPGSYVNEVGFSIQDPSGNEVYSITGMSNYSTYTFIPSCSEIIVPASGSTSITTCNSWIYDNGGSTGDYQNNSDGYIVVTPATTGQGISLEGTYNVESYFDHIYVYAGVGTSGTQIGSYSGSGTISLTNNGTVTIRFTSDNSVVNPGFAIHATCASATAPSAPTGVTATVSGSQIYISWNSVSNATSYKVYRSSSASGTYSQIGSATSNTYLYDSNPLTGYNYYKVTAVNSAGESAFSSVASCNYSDGGTAVPTVTTSNVSGISTTTATSGGNVTSNGGFTVTARGVCWSTSQNPTVSGSHTTNGSGTGGFTSSITGLSANTTYYVRAYATNSAGTAYGEQQSFTTASDGQPCPDAPTMTDYEGHNYPTVQIGTQCWMAKNLRTTHYSNGTSIPTGGTELSTTDPYYYNYTSSNINITERGYLYNWPAVMQGASSSNTYPSGVQGICPTGWHVPSVAEWTLLTDYVSDQSQYWCNNNNTYTAKALAATTGWDTYSGTCCVGNNQSANNATGFAAVPAGKHYYSIFDDAGTYAFFWSATQYSGSYAYDSRLIYTSDNSMAFTTNNFKDFGYSVRCLRDPIVTTPTVTTNMVSAVTTTTATCGGNVTSDGEATVNARGVCWSTSQNPTINSSYTTDGSGTGSFTSYITGLAANTTYYVRAYATNIAGTAYGEQKIFTTPVGALPTVTTNTVSNVTTSTATCGGDVSSAGGTYVTARGVCWGTSQNPTVSGSHTTNGSGTGGFTSNITGLSANTTYYVRAYATNSAGTAYGTQRTFTTTAGASTVPTVTTNSVSNTGTTSATCGGNVTSDGGATVTARGVCWSTSQNPTTSSSHTTNGSGTGSFTSSITGLTANTTYYVRAYATNSAGTAYGTQRTFTTEAGSGTPPTVTTNTVSNVSTTTATCGGNVTNSGSTSVTARGVCWSTSQNPTVSGSHTTNGSGTGSFTSSITGLTANTTYYVRAYAINSAGTAYGTQRTFTTEAGSGTPPTVTTNTVSNVSTTTAACGGNVTSSGSASVTARGVCWSTSQNPTVSGSHTTNGSGTGSFTSNITGLTANTTYYVRAYATNSVGTAYGTQRTFTTSAGAEPTVTTSTVSNIGTTSATCGGNVTSAGGTSVTARGVCWSTSQNPTVTGSHTTNGSGTGSFTSNITGLTANTIYYVRAYATNSAGTAYGTQRTFTTNAGDPPTVTTNTVSNIGITTATCGGNVTNAGGTSVTARGVCWSTSQNPTVSGSHTSNGSGTGSFTSNITGLTAATTYYVRAYATNSGGTSYGTQRSFTTTGGIPCPPTLSVSGTVSQTLHWTDNNSTGCGTPTSFQVWQRIPCTNAYAQIATTTSHYYTNYDVHPGINRYKVVAVNNAGSEESAVASSSSVPLSSPGNLWVDDLGGNCLQFTWSEVDWASRYEIQYSTNGSSYHSDITINNGSQTTTTKCYPQFSGIVYFRIRAVFDDCSSIDDPVYSSWSAAQSHWF